MAKYIKGFSLILLSLLFLLGIGSFYYSKQIKNVIYFDTVAKYSEEYDVDLLFLIAIIKVESKFSKSAKSHRGAMGLMQLMPETAKGLAKELKIKHFRIESLLDPETNIRFGTYYLSKLKKEFKGDSVSILAAYNAGSGKAKEWLNGKNSLKIDDISYSETKKFVGEVKKTHSALKFLQGIKNIFR